jgi:hypothetical protein
MLQPSPSPLYVRSSHLGYFIRMHPNSPTASYSGNLWRRSGDGRND